MEPKNIGRYEIKAEIGRGGMATVYLAYDPRFKREVAIKVLPSQFLHDPTFRARFEREAMTIAAIEHPGIVPVYDYGEENGQPYLVMRYMHGGSLSDLLKKGPMNFRDAAHIVSQLAPALDEMHSRGIIHRDLKPGNILFDHYGNACISDFGIARLTEATTTLTGDSLIGTPSYMSPEQARGDTDIDGRSDIYALGAILFEMLTGKQPYQATTPMGIVMKHITEPVPRILEIRSDLPPGTENVITRAMAKKREERFPTARDLASAQEAILGQLAARQDVPTTFEKAPPVPVVEKSPEQASRKPPEVKAPVSKPPVSVPGTSAPVSRPSGAVPPRPATDSGQAARQPSARIVPQPVYTPSKPASIPAIQSVEPEAVAGPNRRILAVVAIVAILGLCLLAGVFGIPSILNTLRPTATFSVAIASPVSSGALDNTPETESTSSPHRQMDVFIDRFDNPDSGWERKQEDGSIADYEAGFYRIYIDKPSTFDFATPGLDFTDVKLEVEATKTSGPDNNFFGLICRYQDPFNFYILAISSDGYYSIRKYQDGVFYFLGADHWVYSTHIHQGKTENVLQADCIGDTLVLYANGTKLAEVQDTTFHSGDVGLTAASLDQAGANILFDNFVAAKP